MYMYDLPQSARGRAHPIAHVYVMEPIFPFAHISPYGLWFFPGMGGPGCETASFPRPLSRPFTAPKCLNQSRNYPYSSSPLLGSILSAKSCFIDEISKSDDLRSSLPWAEVANELSERRELDEASARPSDELNHAPCVARDKATANIATSCLSMKV